MLASIAGLEFVASGKKYHMTHGTNWEIPADFDRHIVDLLGLGDDLVLAQFISSYYYATHVSKDIAEYVEIVNAASEEMDPSLLIDSYARNYPYVQLFLQIYSTDRWNNYNWSNYI